MVVYALKGCLPPACAGVTMVKGLHPPVKGLSSPRRLEVNDQQEIPIQFLLCNDHKKYSSLRILKSHVIY